MRMSKKQQTGILDSENVARAIFCPLMVDNTGKLTKAAFFLRHNEDYYSVARMNIDSWQNDIQSIPGANDRIPYGYAIMNVGEIRSLELSFFDSSAIFEVEDKSSLKNMSHAGITVCFEGKQLKGDKKLVLKPLKDNMPASILMLKIQSKLVNLANKSIVKW